METIFKTTNEQGFPQYWRAVLFDSPAYSLNIGNIIKPDWQEPDLSTVRQALDRYDLLSLRDLKFYPVQNESGEELRGVEGDTQPFTQDGEALPPLEALVHEIYDVQRERVTSIEISFSYAGEDKPLPEKQQKWLHKRFGKQLLALASPKTLAAAAEADKKAMHEHLAAEKVRMMSQLGALDQFTNQP